MLRSPNPNPNLEELGFFSKIISGPISLAFCAAALIIEAQTGEMSTKAVVTSIATGVIAVAGAGTQYYNREF